MPLTELYSREWMYDSPKMTYFCFKNPVRGMIVILFSLNVDVYDNLGMIDVYNDFKMFVINLLKLKHKFKVPWEVSQLCTRFGIINFHLYSNNDDNFYMKFSNGFEDEYYLYFQIANVFVVNNFAEIFNKCNFNFHLYSQIDHNFYKLHLQGSPDLSNNSLIFNGIHKPNDVEFVNKFLYSI